MSEHPTSNNRLQEIASTIESQPVLGHWPHMRAKDDAELLRNLQARIACLELDLEHANKVATQYSEEAERWFKRHEQLKAGYEPLSDWEAEARELFRQTTFDDGAISMAEWERRRDALMARPSPQPSDALALLRELLVDGNVSANLKYARENGAYSKHVTCSLAAEWIDRGEALLWPKGATPPSNAATWPPVLLSDILAWLSKPEWRIVCDDGLYELRSLGCHIKHIDVDELLEQGLIESTPNARAYRITEAGRARLGLTKFSSQEKDHG